MLVALRTQFDEGLTKCFQEAVTSGMDSVRWWHNFGTNTAPILDKRRIDRLLTMREYSAGAEELNHVVEESRLGRAIFTKRPEIAQAKYLQLYLADRISASPGDAMITEPWVHHVARAVVQALGKGGQESPVIGVGFFVLGN